MRLIRWGGCLAALVVALPLLMAQRHRPAPGAILLGSARDAEAPTHSAADVITECLTSPPC